MTKTQRKTQHQKLDNITKDVVDLKIGIAKLETSVSYLNKFLWAVVGVTVINALESMFGLFTNHVAHWITILFGR